MLPWCGQVDTVVEVDASDAHPILRVQVMRSLDAAPEYGSRSAVWFSHRSAVHRVAAS